MSTRLPDGLSDRLAHWAEEIPHVLSSLRSTLGIVFANDLAKVGIAMILVFAVMAVFAPYVAPHDPDERVTLEDGSWVKDHPPSLEYPFGTTTQAFPVFSQLVYGTRVAFIAGLLTALMVGGFGTVAGIVAGYRGGWLEAIIMRVADVAYGVPYLPFAIVLIIVLGGGSLFTIIAVISLILWRSTARVIRSEVISIKQQPMIDAARASGASDARIIFSHVFPKVLPTSVLYSIFAIGWAIISEAGLSFIGLGPVELISWGRMLNEAYVGNALQQELWWWIFPPGVSIVLFVLAVYFISQGLEEIANPQLRE